MHSVNTIAWAVREDAAASTATQTEWFALAVGSLCCLRPAFGAGDRGLSLRACPDSDVFVLGNHGLVIGGEDCYAVEALLFELERRLAILPRMAQPADYAALEELCQGSSWDLPEDDQVHALGTDAISRAILSGGLLYPCQAIFANSSAPDLFRPIPCPDLRDESLRQYRNPPFLIVEGRGVLVSRTMKPAELAMISGLAQIVQRVHAGNSLRYLSEDEVATGST